MARLLAANVAAGLAHALGDVAVADAGAQQAERVALEEALQAQVGHDGGDDAAAAQPAVGVPGARDQREDLVAVDDLTALVGQDQPVGVAVERDAEVGAVGEDVGAEIFRVGRAAVAVDVGAVGVAADPDDVGAQLTQRGGRDLVGGAVRAIDDDLEAVEAQAAWEGRLGRFDVAAGGVGQARGAAEILGGGESVGDAVSHQGLDLGLLLVGQLEAAGTEELDAVVFEGIVRGGDHDAEVGAQAARQHRDGGGGHRAHLRDVHAGGQEAGNQGVLDHVAGQAGVLADDDPVPMAAAVEEQAGGLAEPERGLGGHRIEVGGAAYAVGSE